MTNSIPWYPRNDCEPEYLQGEVEAAMVRLQETRGLLMQIFEVAAPEASIHEIEAFETYLELMLQAQGDLISAQNIAHSAGLTAEGG